MTRDEALDVAAQHLVDALAELDRLTPEQAATAAGLTDPAERATYIARLTAERTRTAA